MTRQAASAQGGASTADQPTPARSMQVGTAFAGSKAVLTAVQFGLFGVLAEGPLDGETLRDRLGLHARATAEPPGCTAARRTCIPGSWATRSGCAGSCGP